MLTKNIQFFQKRKTEEVLTPNVWTVVSSQNVLNKCCFSKLFIHQRIPKKITGKKKKNIKQIINDNQKCFLSSILEWFLKKHLL